MKRSSHPLYYLALPVLTTALNVLLALLVNSRHVDAQMGIPVVGGGGDALLWNHRQQQQLDCVTDLNGNCVVLDPETETKAGGDVSLNEYMNLQQEVESSQLSDLKLLEEHFTPLKQKEDPMLETMTFKGIEFKAYKRADISSMYREPEGSRTEVKPKFKGQAGKFVNQSPEILELHWDAGQGLPGRVIGVAGPFESTGTSTFPGHVFHYVKKGQPERAFCSFTVVPGVSVYYCNPYEDASVDDAEASSGTVAGSKRDLSSLTPEQKELYDAAQFNREFAGAYKNFTGGSEWLGNFPTQPPQHFMWPADYFGQEHHVLSKETHFTELPPEEKLNGLSTRQMRRNVTDSISLPEFRELGWNNITLKVVSVNPRILQIDNFLSEAEVQQ